MPEVDQDMRAVDAELRLLDAVVELARRCEGRPTPEILDAVLAGTLDARSVLPLQRKDLAP